MKGGFYNDVTPLRLTTSAGAVTFAATNGSSELNGNSHKSRRSCKRLCNILWSSSLGGLITATVLNQEYYVTEVVNTGSYKIKARAAGTSISDINLRRDNLIQVFLLRLMGSDTGNGSSVVGKYQINTGLDIGVSGAGGVQGTWSRGTWGSASSESIVNKYSSSLVP